MSIFLKHMDVYYQYYDTNYCAKAEWKRLLKDGTNSTLERFAVPCSTRVEGGVHMCASAGARANMLDVCIATSGADHIVHSR